MARWLLEEYYPVVSVDINRRNDHLYHLNQQQKFLENKVTFIKCHRLKYVSNLYHLKKLWKEKEEVKIVEE